MTRQEFLEELRVALQGEVSQAQVNENLNYYDNYIMEECSKGRTEQQVLDELGSPRLIAKTIIDMAEQPYIGQETTYYEEDTDTAGSEPAFGNPKGFHVNFDEKNGWDIRIGKFKINSWYGTVIIVGIIALIFFLLFHIAVAVIPILIPILLVVFLISYFKNR